MLHFCGTSTEVKDSRPAKYKDNAYVRRRRYCPYCRVRFSTVEVDEDKFNILLAAEEAIATEK